MNADDLLVIVEDYNARVGCGERGDPWDGACELMQWNGSCSCQ